MFAFLLNQLVLACTMFALLMLVCTTYALLVHRRRPVAYFRPAYTFDEVLAAESITLPHEPIFGDDGMNFCETTWDIA